MALTSIVGTTVFKSVWGKCRVYLYSAVTQGALIAADTSNDGFILADASTSIPAELIAMEAGAAGATIWACAAAVVGGTPTFTAGTWAEVSVAAAGDVSSPVYVGESGDLLLSAGTIAQTVGRVLSTSELFLCPSTFLTGTDISASGTLAVTGNSTFGGTVEVTGASTLTGAVGITGQLTCAEAGGVAIAKGYKISDGGTVTQGTNATTAVTCDKNTGQITTYAENIAAAGEVSFTVNNSVVAATSVVIVNIASGSVGGTTIASVTAIGAGSFVITLTNLHASVAESGTLVINFAVFTGSAT